MACVLEMVGQRPKQLVPPDGALGSERLDVSPPCWEALVGQRTSLGHGGLTSARSLPSLLPIRFFEVRVPVEAVFVELGEAGGGGGGGVAFVRGVAFWSGVVCMMAACESLQATRRRMKT